MSTRAWPTALRLIRRGIVPILLILFFVLPAVGLFRLPSTSMEETSILQYASMTADGHTPTKDFWTEYGPLNVYAPAAVFTVTGPSLVVERIIGLLYRAILLGSLYAILRHYSRRIAVLGIALTWWLLAPALATNWTCVCDIPCVLCLLRSCSSLSLSTSMVLRRHIFLCAPSSSLTI